jgi:hypothetical protein
MEEDACLYEQLLQGVDHIDIEKPDVETEVGIYEDNETEPKSQVNVRNPQESDTKTKYPDFESKPDPSEVAKEDLIKRREIEEKVQKQIVTKGSGVEKCLTCKVCGKKAFMMGSKNAVRIFKDHVEGHLGLKWSCTYCPAVFTLARYLDRHKGRRHASEYAVENMHKENSDSIKKEHHEKPTAEEVIKLESSRRVEINKKIEEQTIRTKSELKCKMCSQTWNTSKHNVLQLFKYHVEGHLNLRNPCPYCMATFKTSNILRTHKKKKHVKDYKMEKHVRKNVTSKKVKMSMECKHCDKTLPSARALVTHLAQGHNEKRLNVKQEVKTKNEVKALIQEQLDCNVNNRRKEYSCKVCLYSLPTSEGRNNSLQLIKRHIEKHLKLTVSCTDCPEIFPSINRLNLHRKEEHQYNRLNMSSVRARQEQSEDKRSVTEEEAKSMVEEQLIADHEDLSGRRLLKCKTCNYIKESNDVNARREMKTHIEKHLNIELKCQFCERRFKNRRLLKQHNAAKHEAESIKHEAESFKHEAESILDDRKVVDIIKAVDQIRLIRSKKPNKMSKAKEAEEIASKAKEAEDIAVKVEANVEVTKLASGKRQYRCRLCGETGGARTPLLLHVELHLDISHACARCDTVERSRSGLKLHMFTAHS